LLSNLREKEDFSQHQATSTQQQAILLTPFCHFFNKTCSFFAKYSPFRLKSALFTHFLFFFYKKYFEDILKLLNFKLVV